MDVYKAPKNISKELFDQCIKTGIPLYFEKSKVALEVRKPYTVDSALRFTEEQCVQKSKLINGQFLSNSDIAKKPIKVMNRYDEEYVLMPVQLPKRKLLNVIVTKSKRKAISDAVEDVLYATQFINGIKKGTQACLDLTDHDIIEMDASVETSTIATEQTNIEDTKMTNEVKAVVMKPIKDSKAKNTKLTSVYTIPHRLDDDFMWSCIRKNIPLYTTKLPTAAFKVEKFNKKKHIQFVEMLENPTEDKDSVLQPHNIATLPKSAFNSRSAFNTCLSSIYADRKSDDENYSPRFILVKNRATYIYVFTVICVDEQRIRRLDYLTGEASVIQEDTASTKLDKSLPPPGKKLPEKKKTKVVKTAKNSDTLESNPAGTPTTTSDMIDRHYTPVQQYTSNLTIHQEALAVLNKLADITKDIASLVAKLSQ